MMRILTIGIIAAVLLSACGQKGPLTLPHTTTISNTAQKATTPAPNVATPGKPLHQHNIIISS